MRPTPASASEVTQLATDPLRADAPADAVGPLAEGEVIGHYRVLGRLGSGGMGHVHRALDLRLQREVALKTAGRVDASTERTLQEARALAALNHPNVVTVYELGVAESRPYIVMELLRGETLRARIDRAPVDFRDALGWAADALRGLAAAHGAGVLHLDLKPENLFLTHDGVLKILDFGVARLARGASVEGEVVGTVPYMAPEQVAGAAVDARADLFAVGVMLFELATGRHPFKGADRFARLRAGERVAPPSDVVFPDRDVEAVARQCLAHDPAERPASAAEVLERLERARRARAFEPWRGRATPAPGARSPLADVAPLAQKTYSVRVEAGDRLVIEGSMTPRDPEQLLFPHFQRVHGCAAGCGELVLDVRRLKLVNSATLGLFIRWVGWIRAEPDDRRYRLVIVADPAVLWQRANLKPLEMIAPEVLQVVTEA